jgi:hypothetical protein
VLIASPSDLAEERQIATEAINEWNSQYAMAEGAVLLPVKWETHATPRSGVRPQQAINEELVQSSDILVGMFWTRFGTNTGIAESGTVEEIDQFLAAAKPAMLYFSRRPIDPNSINLKQQKKLQNFKASTYITYDARDRELTRTFPADSTRNISKTYDQTGGTFGYGDGIGHLTTMTDNAGTMHRQFDERGNILHHQRLDGLSQIDTYAGIDQNNRMWFFNYPNNWMLLYSRDNAGQITGISSIQQSGSWVFTGATAIVSSVTHLPLGPVSGLSFHNGITKTNTSDLDYGPTETKDAATSSVMDLTYTYDANNNPTAIADAVNAANGQSSIGYDNMDRLTGSTSGTGGFGTLAWTYDANANRSTEVRNGTTVTYTYNSGTNQIHGFNDSNNTNYV